MEFHFIFYFFNEYERRYLHKTIFETFLTMRIFYHSNLTRFLGDLALNLRDSDLLKFSDFLLWFQRYKTLLFYIF
jgi:hypothetical protein